MRAPGLRVVRGKPPTAVLEITAPLRKWGLAVT